MPYVQETNVSRKNNHFCPFFSILNFRYENEFDGEPHFKMHFVDFLLQLLCFICWTLKILYIFSFEYVIPIIGFILPVLVKYLSQFFTLLLRGFFSHIAPFIINVINGTTYVFTHLIDGINFIFVSIVESELNLEYAHAIAMTSILVAIVYFNITGKMLSFIRFFYEMIMLYVRFIINISKVVTYVYIKIVGGVKKTSDQTTKVTPGRERRLSSIKRKHTTNGVKLQYKETNNNSCWNNNEH